MKIDKYGRVEISSDELFESFYSGNTLNTTQIFIESTQEIEKFNNSISLNGDKFNTLQVLDHTDIPLDKFDSYNQSKWFMPDEYKNMNIAEWLVSQCKTDEESARVIQELELFIQHNMIEILQYLKYLVDIMRSNKIVWGVGRGSSVSSYVLFLIGVHRIDSLKYNLDINEFLR